MLCRWGFALDPVTGRRIRRVACRTFGTGGGAWLVPIDRVRPGTRVLSAGVGLDASFDLAAATAGAEVVMLDPTPGARKTAEAAVAAHDHLRFLPVGLWEESGERVFHAPACPDHISHSITALQGERPGFRAECRTLPQVAKELGWETIDVLKLDIEGAEYAVLSQWLEAERPAIWVICVEFDETHTPMDAQWRIRIRKQVSALESAGYVLTGVRGKGDYVFVMADGAT
jgi:FkbM family methyltransferase